MRLLLLSFGVTMAVCLATPANAQQPADKYNYSRTADFAYTALGQLQSYTVEKDTASLCQTTTYSYDAYGNKSGVTTQNCAGATGRAVFATRQATTSYDAQGVSSCVAKLPASAPVALQPGAFPTVGNNALGHQETTTFDARFGSATNTQGPNCLTTNWQVDDFGRTVRETRADGTYTAIWYCYVGNDQDLTSSNTPNCPAPSSATEIPREAVSFVYMVPYDKNNGKNGPFSRVYVDAAGRTIRTVTEGFDGSLIYQDSDYDPFNNPVIVTQPYFASSGASVATNSANSYGMTMTVYDALGRPATVYDADPVGSSSTIQFGNRGSRQASVTQISYNGLSTTTTKDGVSRRLEERNIDGQIIRVTDAIGAQVAYQFDAFGNLVKTKDAMQNVIAIDYDIRGRKMVLTDPDLGVRKYDYNALGELVWEESPNQRANGQSTTYVIDALGRITSRTEPEFVSTWTYDRYADGTACSFGIGKLCESSTNNGISERTFYDSLGRPQLSRKKITNGPTFTTTLGYDDSSRVASMTYPSGLQVSYGYKTGLGFLETVSGNSMTYWTAQRMNAWGQIEQQIVGNNVQTNVVFDPQTGRTMEIGAGAGNAVFHHEYVYDSLNNLKSRNDSNGIGDGKSVKEVYSYDEVNRLAQYTISNINMTYPSTRQVDLRYNELGSLSYKSDVGTYAYPANGTARPHAVTSIAGAAANSYQYDANGNLTDATGGKYRKLTYTSFDLPDGNLGIQGGDGTRYTWMYDAAHARIKEVRTNAQGTRTTWNVHPDNLGALEFEQEVGSTGLISNRHYLSAGGIRIGMITTSGVITNPDSPQATDASASIAKVEYWHLDALGSTSAITDAAGTVTQRMAYDPFGKRRNVSGDYDANGAITIDNPQGTDRGFTGHEEMDDIGIVHMNGRIYDPNIGRVMQADPLIQAPDNLQSFNRYSYVINNPLNTVDPSGYKWHFLVQVGRNWRGFWNWITGQGVGGGYSSDPSGHSGPSSSYGGGFGGAGCSNSYGGSGTYSCGQGIPGSGGSNAAGNGGSFFVNNGSGTSSGGHPVAPATPVSNEASAQTYVRPAIDDVPQFIEHPVVEKRSTWEKFKIIGDDFVDDLLHNAEAIPGEGAFVGTVGRLGKAATIAETAANVESALAKIPEISPTYSELRRLGVKGFQAHHILPQWLGKMLGYSEKEMLNHPATLVSQWSHTGAKNPSAMHKAINEYLPYKRGVTYTVDQIRVGLKDAYESINRSDLYRSIEHLLEE